MSEIHINEDSNCIDKIEDIDIEAFLSRSRPLATRRPRNLYSAPEFVKRLESFVETEAGNQVVFECKLKGFPQPNVKWYKDEDEVTDFDKYKIERDGGELKLVIDRACKGDEAAYKCKAENQEGVSSTTGYLSVKGEKLLSKQSNNNKHTDRSVSYPPHLRSIREQYSLEASEAEDCMSQWPSPVHAEVEEMMRRGHTWPRMKRNNYGDQSPQPENEKGEGYDFFADDYEYEDVFDNIYERLSSGFSTCATDSDGYYVHNNINKNALFDGHRLVARHDQNTEKLDSSNTESNLLYLCLLIALATSYAAITNTPAHWYVLFWALVSLFTICTGSV